MFEDAKAHLAEGGRLFLVIRKQQGAPSALKFLKELYAEAETIRARRRLLGDRTQKVRKWLRKTAGGKLAVLIFGAFGYALLAALRFAD